MSVSVPMSAATGPDARAPTKLPAIAAAVQIGNRRFAWRASNVDAATVQPIVTAVAPADEDRQPRDRDGESEARRDGEPLDDEQTRRPRPGWPRTAARAGPARAPRRRPARRPATTAPSGMYRTGSASAPEATDDERVGADLADAATGLERREHAGHEEHQAALLRPDAAAAMTRAIAVTPPASRCASATRDHRGDDARPACRGAVLASHRPGEPRTRPNGSRWGTLRADRSDGDPEGAANVAKVTMPQLGESVAEGTIGKWLKQPGDHVDKYEPLLEVITDKVNAEVPSPFEGVLKEILAEEGATVPNNAEIAVIETADDGAAASNGTGAEHDRRGTPPPRLRPRRPPPARPARTSEPGRGGASARAGQRRRRAGAPPRAGARRAPPRSPRPPSPRPATPTRA